MDHIASLMLGLGNGGVFAALALALVITYRASGVVNFATGAIALYAAYTYAALRKGALLVPVPGLPKSVELGQELGFAPAAAIALVLAAVMGALLYLVVFRPLRDAPPLAKAVASLGVLVVLQGVMAIRQGTNPVTVAPIFPAKRWELGSVLILSDRAYLALTVAGLALVLAASFRFTRFGLLTRATAESQTGAYVSGVSPDRVALVNWMISAVIAGMAGILIAPVSPLTPVTYTLFVVPALAAAVVGRFQWLVVIVAAGIAIGMLQSEALSLAAQHDWVPQTGSSELVPLIVILVALVAIGGGMPARGGLVRQPLGRAPRPRSLLVPTLVGAAVGVLALVLTAGTWRAAVIGTFIAAIIGLSLVVVTGYAGQVSLAQLALAGTAAFTLSFLTQSWDMPFPLAPLLAALVATVIGVAVGLPALRLRGLTLGVVTLALAYAIEAVWFRNVDIVPSSGARVTPPSLFGADLGIGAGKEFPRMQFGLVCLVTLVARGVGRRQPAAQHAGLGDAGGAGQRALGGRGRRQRRAGEGPELRAGVVHRRPGRRPARLPPGGRDVRLVHGARRAGPALDRLPGRRDVGVGRHQRGRAGGDGHRVRGPGPLGRPRPVVHGHQRDPADRHPDLQPRGRGRRGPPDGRPLGPMAGSRPRRGPGPAGGRGRRGRRPRCGPRRRRARPAVRHPGAGGRAPHRALRRRHRGQRRVAAGATAAGSSASSARTAPARRA